MKAKSPTEKLIESAYAKGKASSAKRKKEIGSLAVEAWKCLLIAGLNSDAWDDYDDLANSAFKAAHAMHKKLEKEGAL